MKAVQLAPHGKMEWPRWRPQSHRVRHFRTLAEPAGLAVVVAVTVLGASAALAPVRPPASIAPFPQSPMFEALRADAVSASAMPLSALRKVFDPSELAAIAASRGQAASLGASRQDERILDRQLKGQTTAVTTSVTLDPSGLAASKTDDRTLDRQMQARRFGAGTVTTMPTRFAGKPLPF